MNEDQIVYADLRTTKQIIKISNYKSAQKLKIKFMEKSNKK